MSDDLSKLTHVDRSSTAPGRTANPAGGAGADSGSVNEAAEKNVNEPSPSSSGADSKLPPHSDLAGDQANVILADQKPVGDGTVSGSSPSASGNVCDNSNNSAIKGSSTHDTGVGDANVNHDAPKGPVDGPNAQTENT